MLSLILREYVPLSLVVIVNGFRQTDREMKAKQKEAGIVMNRRTGYVIDSKDSVLVMFSIMNFETLYIYIP